MTEDELDTLHEEVMRNFYQVFADEFDAYFTFKEAAMNVLWFGNGHFPFSTQYDCCMPHINKTLEVIEQNILFHLDNEMDHIFKTKRKDSYISKHSEDQKKEFSKKIRSAISKKFME